MKRVVELPARGGVGQSRSSITRVVSTNSVNVKRELPPLREKYIRAPESTLVVSPDNRSRCEINLRIHGELQTLGKVSQQEFAIRTLAPRQEMTGADRSWAKQYQRDDIVRYSRASRETARFLDSCRRLKIPIRNYLVDIPTRPSKRISAHRRNYRGGLGCKTSIGM